MLSFVFGQARCLKYNLGREKTRQYAPLYNLKRGREAILEEINSYLQFGERDSRNKLHKQNIVLYESTGRKIIF